MHRTDSTRKTRMTGATRNRTIIPGLLAVAIIAASCASTESSVDNDRACRIAQRLVNETADGDVDGIERQLGRFGDIEGIDELTDVRELEDLTESGDEDDIDDIADQLDDDLDCELDVPRIVDVTEAAPPETITPAVEPTATEPPTSTSPVTEPVDADPLVVVDIGADVVIDPDVVGVEQTPTALVADAGVTSLPIPAGEAVGTQYEVSYLLFELADTPTYLVDESATFAAMTDQTTDQVRDAFASSIAEATGEAYDATESTASRDEVSESAVDLEPENPVDDFRYNVTVSESTELPGLVYITVTATGRRDGALPALPPTAAAQFASPTDVASTLGWQPSAWSFRVGAEPFTGAPIVNAEVSWIIGPGTVDDLAAESTELLALLPEPGFEAIDTDRHSFTLDDGARWAVRYADSFEGAELRSSYAFYDA